MAIASTDLVAYGCANHAEDDSSTQGGAIDTTKKIAMTFVPYAEEVEAFSSSASDTTQILTITGRTSAGGSIETETISLNGTNVVKAAVPKTWERVLKITMALADTDATAAAGTVTVRGGLAGPTIATLEAGVLEVRTLFYDSSAIDTDAPISLYEKFFFKNTHGTLALTSANLTLTAEPVHVSDFLIAVEDSVDSNGTSTNRKTAPTGINTDGFVQKDAVQQVPGGELAAGEAIGVWIRMDLTDSNSALVDSFSVQLNGNTA